MQEDDATRPFWTDELEGNVIRLGLTESFLENLGDDPVAVELAAPGAKIRPGETLGFLYTPEQTHELRAPRALEIINVNPAVEDARLIQQSPYTRGWLIDIRWLQ